MFTTEGRWERIAAGFFWMGWLFVVFTVHAIYSRDDWRGIVMTAAPAAMMFAGWWLARARAEYLLTTAKPPRGLKIASTLIIAAGLVALIYNWSNPRVVYVVVQDQPFQNLSPAAIEKLTLSSEQLTEAPADPTLIAPEGCDEWVRARDKAGDMIGYCKHWAPK